MGVAGEAQASEADLLLAAASCHQRRVRRLRSSGDPAAGLSAVDPFSTCRCALASRACPPAASAPEVQPSAQSSQESV